MGLELKYEELTSDERAELTKAIRLYLDRHTSAGPHQARLAGLAEDIEIGYAKVLYAPAHVWRETRIGARRS